MKNTIQYILFLLLFTLTFTTLNAQSKKQPTYIVLPPKAFYTIEHYYNSNSNDIVFSPKKWYNRLLSPVTEKELNDNFQKMFFRAYPNYSILKEFKPIVFTYDKMDYGQKRSERELLERVILQLDYESNSANSRFPRKYEHRWAPLIHNITKGDIPDYLVFVVCHATAEREKHALLNRKLKGNIYMYTVIIDTKTMDLPEVLKTSNIKMLKYTDVKITEKRVNKILKKNQKKHTKYFKKQQKLA